MVDPARLDQLLANLDAHVAVLRRLASMPRDRFLADPDKVGNAKYHFVIAIETCIGIANHVVASEGYRFPRDNADSFSVLAENHVVPPDLEPRLGAMARFRNRLVHVYWAIEDDRVHEYLSTGLDDMADFARAVRAIPR